MLGLSRRFVETAERGVDLGKLLVVPAVRPAIGVCRGRRRLGEPDTFGRSAEGAERLGDRVAGERNRVRVGRVPLALVEGALERDERSRGLLRLEVLPAEVVEQRPEPVASRRLCLGDLDPTLGPSDEAGPVRGCERGHVSRVDGKEVRAGFRRPRKCRLEEREGGLGVAVGSAKAAALEIDPYARPGSVPSELPSVREEALPLLEAAAEPFDAGELAENLGARRVVRLLGEAGAEAALRAFQVVEVPVGAKPVSHERTLEPAGRLEALQPAGGCGRPFASVALVLVEILPSLGDAKASALRIALENAGVPVSASVRSAAGAWARTAAYEAVGYDPDSFPHRRDLELGWALEERYARSPLRTRGATRA
jgi:hypothetical protein